MKRDTSFWIGVLIFVLLVLLGPIWAFPNLQDDLTAATADNPDFQALKSQGAVLKWQGRNGYLRVPAGYDAEQAEAVADSLDLITGVRDVTVIYDSDLPLPAQADPTEVSPPEADIEPEPSETSTMTDTEESASTDTNDASKGNEEGESVPEVSEDQVNQVEAALQAILEFNTIEFASATADLSESSQDAIREIATTLIANESVKLLVVGHTDAQGDDDQNMLLSLERATAIVTALVDQGVNEAQLKSEGRGSTEPIATNDTPEGRKLNRRVEFIGLEN